MNCDVRKLTSADHFLNQLAESGYFFLVFFFQAEDGIRDAESLRRHPMSDIVNVDYSTRIPNNVGLTEDRQVLKALERWHPGFIDWWQDMGPSGFQESLVYLRTAVSVDPKGWAKFDYVKMPEYRWGVLLAPQEPDRKIPFGQ